MHSKSQKRYRNIIILIMVYQIMSIIVFSIFAQKTWVLPILVVVMIAVSLIVDGLLMHAYKGSKDADRLERQIAQIQTKRAQEQIYVRQAEEKLRKLQEEEAEFEEKIRQISARVQEGKDLQNVSEEIAEAGEDLKRMRIDKYCQNSMINTMLVLKRREAEARRITVRIAAEVPEAVGMDDVDLCSVMGNLLDNAIEACDKLPDDKWIDIKIGMRAGYLFVVVENRFDGILREKNGELLTTKADGENHGYGTKILRQIAKKYQGEASFTTAQDVFTARMMLQI